MAGSRTRRAVAVTILCAIAVGWQSTAGPLAAAAGRPFGHAKVLARYPDTPKFPEGVAVRGGRAYVAGPATFGTTAMPPSLVVAFNADTGAVIRRYPTKGENRFAEHANSSIAFDSSGRLYVLNSQLGMYRLNTATGAQQQYSPPFPNLRPCVPLIIGPPCSPTLIDAPPIPNDLAFDAAGNAYVTDSLQATVWKVPAGGGQPQVWFQDIRLASPYIGVNGIRIHPSGPQVYLSVTQDLQSRSTIYRLPLKPHPSAGDLQVFHRYPLGTLPDGIAFGATGLLYVAIATPLASGVSILLPSGAEKTRLKNPPLSRIAPYDSPANIAFDGEGSILLTNHAFVTGIVLPRQFALLDVYVGDNGAPLFQPALP
jgi:sugar lactone lactonase YvrE